MNRTEYIGKLNALYVGDKNCLEELITAYDEKDKEIERLNKALLDIKEYIETNSYFESNIVKTMVFKDYSDSILDIVNKAIGSDKE